MALFANLFHVGKVVAQLIDDGIGPGPTIQVGQPIEATSGTTEEIRVTLLWVSPQPPHRNDRVAIDATGQKVEPPMTLSAFFLITTQGSSMAGVPERAHELLGNVIQIFHTRPTITLTNTATLPGDGRLTFIQPTLTPELVEHIFTPTGVKLRPWVVFEVSPVQLAKNVPPEPPGAQVRPGGIRLVGPEVLVQPQITRLTPARQGVLGVVRLDVDLQGKTFIGVFVGPTFIAAGSLQTIHPGTTFLLTLPSSADVGHVVDIRLQAQNPADVGNPEKPPDKYSNTERLAVLSDQVGSIDAPEPTSVTAPLTFTGRQLTGPVQVATHVLIWPDVALANPDDVKTLVLDSVGSTSVTTDDSPDSVGLTPGTYRAAVAFDTGAFTSFVILELTT